MTRAVVVGAGVAGSLTALGLAERGLAVSLVDRDEVATSGSVRPGLPQATQLHNLLTRAQRELDAVCPGIVAEILDLGGAAATASTDTVVVEYGQTLPRRDLGLRLVTAPRSCIDEALLRRVRAHPRIDIVRAARDRAVVEAGAVRGVRLAGEDVRADLVVDASGLSAGWREAVDAAAGPNVRCDVIEVDQWYVSWRVKRPAGHRGDPTCWLVFPGERSSRGGLISPADADTWTVSLSGRGGDLPPRDSTAAFAYAETLDSPVIAEALKGVEPLSSPRLFRKPEARWYHIEDLGEALPGLAVVGDAVASLNPLLGQGIASAAWQVRLLLDAVDGSDDLTSSEFAQRQRRSTVVPVSAALAMSRIDELDLDDGAGHRCRAVTRLVELTTSAAHDVEAHRRLVEMWHLVRDPVDALLGPSPEPGARLVDPGSNLAASGAE